MSLVNLYRLQQIDSRLDQIQRRQAEIRRQLQDDQRYRHASEHLQACQTRRDEARAQRQKLEYETSAQRIKIAQVEAALYGGKIQNPKELRDLERELVFLKHQLQQLEDRLLEAMIQEEASEEALQASQEAMRNVEKLLATEHSLLSGEASQLAREMERLQAERQVTLQGIERSLLEEYEHLRATHRGLAVSRISEGSCDACGALLTPAQQQQARQPGVVFRCPNCGRILYPG